MCFESVYAQGGSEENLATRAAREIQEVEQLVRELYVGKIPSTDTLMLGVLNGLVSELDDPYAEVFTEGDWYAVELAHVPITVQFFEDTILYIQIPDFHEKTGHELISLMHEMSKRPVIPRLLLDLRGNPGGLLGVTKRFMGYWLDSGIVIFCEEKKMMSATQHIVEKVPRTLRGTPTVLLVDQKTASAGEVLAGAFQDYGIATVVGDTTRGKAFVQTIKKLTSRYYLRVTSAWWTTPLGRNIGIAPEGGRKGLVPDVVVESSPNQKNSTDVVFAQGLSILRTLERKKP